MGLMVAGLLAAYVSTISTHLNWGTSYLVHDGYRRFVRPDASEAHYVWTGRIVTALLMLVAALLTLILDSARTAFDLLLSIGAGTGLLYLLRWFWWRINAFSEIAAMASSFVLAIGLQVLKSRGWELPTHVTLLATVGLTTIVWMTVTLLTPATDDATLVRFYERVRPAGPGWRRVRALAGGMASTDDLSIAFGGSFGGCACVYGVLFGTGHLLLGRTGSAMISLGVAVLGALVTMRAVRRAWVS